MQTKWLTMILLTGFCLTPVAYADAPGQTGAFVKYCADKRNMKECRATMMHVEYKDMAGDNTGVCTIPDGIPPQKANDEILDWMRSHPAYGDQSLHDGMQAAMHDLWGCAKTLNNAQQASGETPETAGAFLTFCEAKENANQCAAEIEMDYGEAKLDGKGGCSAPADMTPREMLDQTLQWLLANPQAAGERTRIAVIAAMAGLWPCH